MDTRSSRAQWLGQQRDVGGDPAVTLPRASTPGLRAAQHLAPGACGLWALHILPTGSCGCFISLFTPSLCLVWFSQSLPLALSRFIRP